MDDNNIIADLKPLDNIHNRILKDNALLIRVIRAWDKLTCALITHDPLDSNGDDSPKPFADVVPFLEYVRLTFSLAYWCDKTTQCTIDPTALTDLICYMQDVDGMLSDGLTPEEALAEVSRRDFNELMGRAFMLTDRITRIAEESLDRNSTPEKKAGRPPGSIGENRKEIEKELGKCTHPRDVAELFKTTTSWVYKIKKNLDKAVGGKLSEGTNSDVVSAELDIDVEYVNKIKREMGPQLPRIEV